MKKNKNERIASLKMALEGLIGASSKKDLTQMKDSLDSLPIPQKERECMSFAIQTLIDETQ